MCYAGSCAALAVTATALELHDAANLRPERVVLADANIRAGVNDILETAFINTRAVYDAPRSNGNLSLLQINESRTGPWGFVRISGKF